jgi:polyhydroxyalkanoate synthesis repressor PhaR
VTIIKKYPNRRLYDTGRSSYVNLEQVAERVRDGDPIQVIDARDGTDRTKEVLLQIVLEVLQGADLLPIGMLRRLIRATGSGPHQQLLRRQLATGLELMSEQLDRMEAWSGAPGREAPRRDGFVTPPQPATAPPPPPAPPEGEATERQPDPELDELRERLTELERRLSRR